MERAQLLFNLAVISILLANLFFSYSINLKLSNLTLKENPAPQPNNPGNFRSDCEKELEGYDGVFVYSPNCPFSRRMIPLVEKSELKWYWINVLDSNCRKFNLTGFDYKGFVPHFYCFRTNSSHTGAMSEERFLNWTRANC